MAMMASASSGNPYDNYDNREIEQDLIDPDDGMFVNPQRVVVTDAKFISKYQ